MKRKLIATMFVMVFFFVGIATAKRLLDYRTSRDLKTYDRNYPLNVQPFSSENRTNYIREEFTFEGVPGEEVPVLALVPAGSTNRHPAIILLYGIGMKMNFADKAEVANAVTQAGFALFVPEQYGRGKRRKETVKGLQEFLALRHRIVLTIKETRRLVDVVSRRPDVDPARIYFWGASFGAMTGCSVMAYDERLPAGVFTLSAGDLQKMAADSPYREKLPWFSWVKVAAPAVASFLKPFDPIYHIGRIAPRPLLFQNASNDDLIPRSAVDALYRVAGTPKQIIWYDSPHDRLERAVVEKLVLDALAWLKERDDEVVARIK